MFFPINFGFVGYFFLYKERQEIEKNRIKQGFLFHLVKGSGGYMSTIYTLQEQQ
jgi:hypothetical protein